MDDETKIKALMIYFHYWGKDQAHRRKVIQGIQKTETIWNQYFNGHYTLAMMDMSKKSFWVHMTESLLEGMIHYMPYDDLGDIKPLHNCVKFADAIGASFFSVYALQLSKEEMQSLNAIIALP